MPGLRTRPVGPVAGAALLVAVLAGCQGSSGGDAAGGDAANTPPGSQSAPPAAPSTGGSGAAATPAANGGGDGAAKNTPNPCDLVTQDDAKAALGVDPGKPIHSKVDVADTCVYHSGTKLVSVVVKSTAKAFFDLGKTKAGSDVKPLSDLGPDAVQAGDVVEFWKSGVLVAVGVDTGGGNSIAKEKTVAQAAMARL